MKRLVIAFAITAASIAAMLGAASASSTVPDHYLFYNASAVQEAEVTLEDQFSAGVKQVKVQGLRRFGAPSSKEHAGYVGIQHPDTHLSSYSIKFDKDPPKDPRKVTVVVTNQFDTIEVQVSKPDQLLVPASKSLSGPTTDPGLSAPINHFTCYAIQLSKWDRFQTTIEDQFTGEPKVIAIGRPTRLCAPTAKVHGANEFGIRNAEANLLCYQVSFIGGTDPNTQLGVVDIGDQFVSSLVGIGTVEPKEFCVPSTTSDP